MTKSYYQEELNFFLSSIRETSIYKAFINMTIEKTSGMFRIKTNAYYEGEVVFTKEEVDAIEAAENSSIVQNFPFSEKWDPLPVSYKKSYFARQTWLGLGKVGEEPKVVSIKQILEVIEKEPEETKEQAALNETLSEASEDPGLSEFVRLTEKCKKEAAKEEETQQVSMRKKTKDDAESRPISIVPPLPTRFIKPPTQIKRSDSTLSTGSNVSLESNSSRLSSSSKINAHSKVNHRNGANHHTEGYFPALNRNKFSPGEPKHDMPSKVKTGIASAPSTPSTKRRDPNFFIRRNIDNAGKASRKNVIGSAPPKPF